MLCYFSPAGYRLPAQHLQTVVQTLNAQGVPLCVIQARYQGQQAEPVPSAIPQAVLDTESLLFHKERLWNIAARTLTDAENLVFIDADIVFSTTAWLDRTLAKLKTCDVVQPYETARWLDESGRVDMERQPTAAAIARGIAPTFDKYHPGYGVAMTRKAFDALGGFYDVASSGNGDALFFLGLRDTPEHQRVESWYGKRQDPTVDAQSYVAWKRRAASLRLKVDAVPGVKATHLWHGTRKNRQYITRSLLFPRRPDGEFDTVEAPTGLHEWRDVDASNDSVRSYFVGKRDDG